MRTGKVKPVANDTKGGVNAMDFLNRQKPDQGHNQDKGNSSMPPDMKGITMKGDIQSHGGK